MVVVDFDALLDDKAQKGPFSVNLSLKLAELHVQYGGDI
eukprot:SAG11_NODE_2320_length_3524_cov_71.912993_4_plen_39_part_00